MTPRNLLVFDSVPELQRHSAVLIAGTIRQVLASQERCRIALGGGTTPGPIYSMLVESSVVGELPLSRVDILFGDERFVGPDHEDSNYRMAKEAFGAAMGAFGTVYRMEGERTDRDAAAAAYEEALGEPVDVMLLGMGPDAHVASLFPGSVAFDGRAAMARAIQGPKPPPWRMTVAPQVIESSKHIYVIVAGEGKASAVKDVFHEPLDPSARPAQLALGGTWLMDKAAASAL